MRRLRLCHGSYIIPTTRRRYVSTSRFSFSFYDTSRTKLRHPRQRTSRNRPVLHSLEAIPLGVWSTDGHVFRPPKLNVFPTTPRPDTKTSTMDHVSSRLQLPNLTSKRIT